MRRVRILPLGDEGVRFGQLFGWHYDNECGCLCAVVRADRALWVELVHYSRVDVTPPDWALRALEDDS